MTAGHLPHRKTCDTTSDPSPWSSTTKYHTQKPTQPEATATKNRCCLDPTSTQPTGVPIASISPPSSVNSKIIEINQEPAIPPIHCSAANRCHRCHASSPLVSTTGTTTTPRQHYREAPVTLHLPFELHTTIKKSSGTIFTPPVWPGYRSMRKWE